MPHFARPPLETHFLPFQEPAVLVDSVTSPDLFCGAKLGPPTVLAQACDASMDFLLGPSVSIGMLTSTAKAVNGESLDYNVFRACIRRRFDNVARQQQPFYSPRNRICSFS